MRERLQYPVEEAAKPLFPLLKKLVLGARSYHLGISIFVCEYRLIYKIGRWMFQVWQLELNRACHNTEIIRHDFEELFEMEDGCPFDFQLLVLKRVDHEDGGWCYEWAPSQSYEFALKDLEKAVSSMEKDNAVREARKLKKEQQNGTT
jgi:hypothetical protein